MTILLRSVSNSLADLATLPAHLAPQQPRRTRADGLELKQTFHERALARAIWPEQPDCSRSHLQIDAIQRPLLSKQLAQGLRLYDQWGQHSEGILSVATSRRKQNRSKAVNFLRNQSWRVLKELTIAYRNL